MLNHVKSQDLLVNFKAFWTGCSAFWIQIPVKTAVFSPGFIPDGATIPEAKAEATAQAKEPEHIYEIYVPRPENWGISWGEIGKV